MKSPDSLTCPQLPLLSVWTLPFLYLRFDSYVKPFLTAYYVQAQSAGDSNEHDWLGLCSLVAHAFEMGWSIYTIMEM